MKKKILVFERDAAILEIVAYVLIDEGYHVKALDSSSSIFEAVVEYMPDAILLDVIRPTEEGAEVCQMLKKHPKTKHIPVIVYSTHPKVLATIKQVCADEVLPKPFDISVLVDTVETQLAS
jgi:DNA-binding response OmpR family regulator